MQIEPTKLLTAVSDLNQSSKVGINTEVVSQVHIITDEGDNLLLKAEKKGVYATSFGKLIVLTPHALTKLCEWPITNGDYRIEMGEIEKSGVKLTHFTIYNTKDPGARPFGFTMEVNVTTTAVTPINQNFFA